MTVKTKSVTEQLLEAQAILDKEKLTTEDLGRVRDLIEAAFSNLQLQRCEAMAALDQL